MRSSGNTRFLNRILRRALIKNHVWFGCGLMLTLLIVMPLSTLNVTTQLNQGVNAVTEKIQPVVIKTQNIELELEGTSSSVGYYLLTREDRHKDNAIDHLKRAKKLADQLAESQVVSANSSYSNILELVKKDLTRLESYQDLMIEMPNNDLKNIPAQQMASEQLKPMSQSWQSIISQMIISAYTEDNVDGVRDEYRQTIYDLRYYNAQIVSELRIFLDFRSNRNIQNLNSIREVVLAKIKAIGEAEDFYTFEKSDLMPEFLSLTQAYDLALDQAINIHSSDRYRRNIYLINNEIGPLVVKIQAAFSTLTTPLKGSISTTGDDLQNTASSAIEKVFIGLVAGLLAGVIIAISMMRMMSIPINVAVRAMEDLADGEGDLTRRLAGSGNANIAKMAQGFSSFAGKVQILVSEVAGSVVNLSAVVSQISAIVDNTQSGSSRQRQQTQQVVTAIAASTYSDCIIIGRAKYGGQ